MVVLGVMTIVTVIGVAQTEQIVALVVLVLIAVASGLAWVLRYELRRADRESRRAGDPLPRPGGELADHHLPH
jgi:hypothetical protein